MNPYSALIMLAHSRKNPNITKHYEEFEYRRRKDHFDRYIHRFTVEGDVGRIERFMRGFYSILGQGSAFPIFPAYINAERTLGPFAALQVPSIGKRLVKIPEEEVEKYVSKGIEPFRRADRTIGRLKRLEADPLKRILSLPYRWFLASRLRQEADELSRVKETSLEYEFCGPLIKSYVRTEGRITDRSRQNFECRQELMQTQESPPLTEDYLEELRKYMGSQLVVIGL